MADTATATPVTKEQVIAELKAGNDQIVELKGQVESLTKSVSDLTTKANTQVAPYGVVGAFTKDSDGYSIMKAIRYANGLCSAEEAKYERDTSEKLKNFYMSGGWRPTMSAGNTSFVVPYCTKAMPRDSSESERLVGELRQSINANASKVDPEEAEWITKKFGGGMVQKALGTVNDTAGGVLVGFPTLGELVDLQRNIEVFPKAGATEQPLPPNGRIQYPKLTNATTAYWLGEGATVTSSTNVTGYLNLVAKKLGIFTDINNELIRFGSITAEAMIRGDMAKVGALAADLAMLEGTGGNSITGLINYPSASSWSTGNDKLLTYTVTSNLLQVKDAAEMEAIMPDTAGEPTAWLMRRNLWAKLRNRRADAVSAADAAGQFLPNITRSLSDRLPYEWDGTPVIRSSQISNTRGSGAQTYAILGYFPDWIIARFGVMEFLMTNTSDTALQTDITRLRAIMSMDAGARHASSFVFADAITIS